MTCKNRKDEEKSSFFICVVKGFFNPNIFFIENNFCLLNVGVIILLYKENNGNTTITCLLTNLTLKVISFDILEGGV